jgi:glycosyltransferase involved in cell wall biosynthesis
MAHGLPVVVAEADGTQSELVGPDNGWLVAPGDLPGLIETLQRALADPARLRRMGEASHRITVEEVNIEVMLQVFLQALEAATGEA